MLTPTKILVPTDFSEYSDSALEQALDIAKQYHAKVFLFHVVHKGFFSSIIDSMELLDKVNKIALDWAHESSQKQLEKFSQFKEVEVHSDVGIGIPYEEILREAKEKKIDLIVIASLGRSGIAKYFIGSVARNVLKGAKCPVHFTK